MTHICVSKQTIIGSDNGLSPSRRQAIIWTNAGRLLIGTLGTKFSETLIEIRIFSFKKMGSKVSSAKWRPFCLGLNVLNGCLEWNQIMDSKEIKSLPFTPRPHARRQIHHHSLWTAFWKTGYVLLWLQFHTEETHSHMLHKFMKYQILFYSSIYDGIIISHSVLKYGWYCVLQMVLWCRLLINSDIYRCDQTQFTGIFAPESIITSDMPISHTYCG